MSKKVFNSAIYKNKDFCEILKLENVNKCIYELKYRNHLFCPNKECNARLKFVPKKNGTIKMFQSIAKKEHVEGCPYKIEYKKYNSPKLNDEFTEKKIIDALKWQMLQFGTQGSYINKINPKKSKHKVYNKRTESSKRYYNCDSVDESLIGDTIVVGGYIYSVKIVDKCPDNIHAYINFHMSSNSRVSIPFSNNQLDKENETFEIFKQIKSKWENTPNGKGLVCLCFGKINKTDTGFKILPYNNVSFSTEYKDVEN